METKEQLQDLNSQLEVIRTIILGMNNATFESSEYVNDLESARGSLKEAYYTFNICFDAIGNVESDIEKMIKSL